MNQLPVPIAKTLVEHPYNFVKYGSDKHVFCESVSSYNGWITMTDLRTRILKTATIQPIVEVTCDYYHGFYKKERDKKNYYQEGYSTTDTKIIPEKIVTEINSYKENKDLAAWAVIPEEQAKSKANEAVQKFNYMMLKTNCERFSNCVEAEVRTTLRKKYDKKRFWQKWLNQKDMWVRKQQDAPLFKKLIGEAIDIVKGHYRKYKIEYEGTLEYKSTL